MPCLHARPTTPSVPNISYPERSFSITIFCSPAEMLPLPEPGVEAESLVPVSCPLPGALSAVWTSLRIRGRGPSLDTMFCKHTARGRCDLREPPGEAKCTAAAVVQRCEEPPGKAGPALPAVRPLLGGGWGAQESANEHFPQAPQVLLAGVVRGLTGEMVT